MCGRGSGAGWSPRAPDDSDGQSHAGAPGVDGGESLWPPSVRTGHAGTSTCSISQRLRTLRWPCALLPLLLLSFASPAAACCVLESILSMTRSEPDDDRLHLLLRSHLYASLSCILHLFSRPLVSSPTQSTSDGLSPPFLLTLRSVDDSDPSYVKCPTQHRRSSRPPPPSSHSPPSDERVDWCQRYGRHPCRPQNRVLPCDWLNHRFGQILPKRGGAKATELSRRFDDIDSSRLPEGLRRKPPPALLR